MKIGGTGNDSLISSSESAAVAKTKDYPEAAAVAETRYHNAAAVVPKTAWSK